MDSGYKEGIEGVERISHTFLSCPSENPDFISLYCSLESNLQVEYSGPPTTEQTTK